MLCFYTVICLLGGNVVIGEIISEKCVSKQTCDECIQEIDCEWCIIPVSKSCYYIRNMFFYLQPTKYLQFDRKNSFIDNK